MEYQANIHYPFSELDAINEWWQTHREYDINEYRETREYDENGSEIDRIYNDYVEIVPRDADLVLSEQRRARLILLEAFDKWEKAVLRDREEDSDVIMSWYHDLLDLKGRAFENVPERIKYYL